MNYESVFRQRLMKKLVELQTSRAEFLLSGTALSARADEVALAYTKAVGYLQALEDVLRLCEVVHDELNQG